MLCQHCKKNEATVFYKENINGKVTSLALCEECAAKNNDFKDFINGEKIHSIFDDAFYSLSPWSSFNDDLFGGLFPALAPVSAGARKKCPSCGSTMDVFADTGKAGCPDCYRTFSQELSNTLRSIHGNAKHIGRVPKEYQKTVDKKNQVASLRKKLNEAIKEENFEEAAKIRDEIKAIESEK